MIRTLLTTLIFFVLSVGTATAQLPTKLVQQSDLVHLGSFVLPDAPGGAGQRCYEYQAPGAIGYRPDTHSLYVTGHAWTQWVGEVSIPTDLSGSAVAAVRQPCKDATDGKLSQINPTDGNGQRIGGLYVAGDRLIMGGFSFYDGGYSQRATHFTRSVNLTSGTASDAFRVGTTQGPGYIGGYIGSIPAAWRTALRGDLLVGQCCVSIISRSSYGPSVSSTSTASVLAGSASATTLVYYPSDHQTLAPYVNPPAGSVWNGATRMRGVAFPDGTASVLFFGYHGFNNYCYSTGPVCNDPVFNDQGEHAYPYQPTVWAYNANELAQVAAGTRDPWSLKPYGVFRLPGMSGFLVSGAALDTAGRLYVLEAHGGPSERGRIHVYAPMGTAGPAPTPTPVDAVVSAWGEWTGGAWSACSGGVQTRVETRTRTVVTPASNGGTTPALSETRTAGQACTVTPPPVDPPPTTGVTHEDLRDILDDIRSALAVQTYTVTITSVGTSYSGGDRRLTIRVPLASMPSAPKTGMTLRIVQD